MILVISFPQSCATKKTLGKVIAIFREYPKAILILFY